MVGRGQSGCQGLGTLQGHDQEGDIMGNIMGKIRDWWNNSLGIQRYVFSSTIFWGILVFSAIIVWLVTNSESALFVALLWLAIIAVVDVVIVLSIYFDERFEIQLRRT